MGGEKEEGQRRPRELGQETQTLTQGQGPSLDLGLFPFVDSEEAGSPLRWKKGELIGEGTFGRVYKGMNERTGELLAIKQLYLSDGTSHEVESLRREIRVMWDLHHDNIVRYMGTSRSERYLFIILEYVTGGSIASMLGQFGPFSEKLLRRFTRHITSGVEYLHSKSIIHRDIKGANILVSDAGVAKLADFGCSKQLAGMFTGSIEESNRGIRGSVPWMAPEVVKQSGHGKASDVWSIGATVIEMATGKPPWPEFSNNLAALFHVATAKTPPPIPLTASPACAQLLSRCLVIDPAERASAFEMLTQCDFLTGESGFRVHSSHLPTPTPTLSAPTSVSASASASAGLADGAVSSHTGDVSISKQ
ncbi:kinase-like domain-containing protein [Ochromonadaceae sp. CCMP2298]|nr:kinase-like domain-containing protein [Ochromonadaceae sp. CCMP2298]